ncbi:MAG: hypothetical protein AAF694_20565 [Bacteroidota bacterium]
MNKKWKWMAPLGLVLIGAGFSLAAEATLWKGAALPTWQWVALGTFGLAVFNSGIVIFGEAVKLSTLDTLKSKHSSQSTT